MPQAALLAKAVPEQAEALAHIAARLVDALPLVREHLYHPAFGGSFSLKSVLPALVPGMGYEGLEFPNGAVACVRLRCLLFDDDVAPAEREQTRQALLQYCASIPSAWFDFWNDWANWPISHVPIRASPWST